MELQRVPALRVFWDLEKTVLHETRVSGTVLWSPTSANSPTYTYISQNCGSGNRVSDFGDPLYIKNKNAPSDIISTHRVFANCRLTLV